MRLLYGLAAVIVIALGLYGFVHDASRWFSATPAPAGCPVALSGEQVARWAEQAVPLAYSFKAGQPPEETSSAAVFTPHGRAEFLSAIRQSRLPELIESRRIAAVGLKLEEAQAVATATRFNGASHGVRWLATLPVQYDGIPGSPAMTLTLSIHCMPDKADAADELPLGIDQWIMTAAR